MENPPKTCKSCGHYCHCTNPECLSCGCDVCDCGTVKTNKEDIPKSFVQPNT
jgi:hypothetical protein